VCFDNRPADCQTKTDSLPGHFLSVPYLMEFEKDFLFVFVGYAGSSDRLDTALARFARLYADLAPANHALAQDR